VKGQRLGADVSVSIPWGFPRTRGRNPAFPHTLNLSSTISASAPTTGLGISHWSLVLAKTRTLPPLSQEPLKFFLFFFLFFPFFFSGALPKKGCEACLLGLEFLTLSYFPSFPSPIPFRSCFIKGYSRLLSTGLPHFDGPPTPHLMGSRVSPLCVDGLADFPTLMGPRLPT
jgi:hypothetical protein